MFENRVQRKIFGPKRTEITRERGDCITRNFIICNPHQILFQLTNKNEKKGGTCGPYERVER